MPQLLQHSDPNALVQDGVCLKLLLIQATRRILKRRVDEQVQLEVAPGPQILDGFQALPVQVEAHRDPLFVNEVVGAHRKVVG